MATQLPEDAHAFLQRLLDRHRGSEAGKLTDYLPEFEATDPGTFAVAVATVDGQLASAGDDRHVFTLQSMSKPFIYGMALDRFGREAVHRKVSVEPTGEAFNSIIEQAEDHLPYNPMINSGAIAMSALLHHAAPGEAAAQVMAMFGGYLGRAAELHAAVDPAQLGGSHRNRAIAHLLRHFEVIGDDIEGALSLYARQCVVAVDTRDLALMAATLANGGVHPRTGRRAIESGHLRDVLTLMFTCGMYDSSGAWAYTVGLPAKSGVSGGILAVVPGRMGLAVYSPRLDAHGHSVRGVEVFRSWAAEWGLGLFDR
ncbi:MAG TPA: glutaminase A [Ramlibacter sp.]|nr:glutaminase A [Ramlibacter sp.]